MSVACNIISSSPLVALRNLTLKTSNCRTYAFKSDLKIKWVRPEKIPCYKPAKSGDLEGVPQIDMTLPQLMFQNSKELATANDVVKKLFSLEYAPRNKVTEVYKEGLKDVVRRHNFDVASIEVRIARWTGIIRAYQEIIDRFPTDKRAKVFLKELIDKRKKHLKYLRRWDYKRFEWLLEAMNIEYKPPPNHFHWITRKESLRKLTNNYCQDIRNDRLESYKRMLQAEQPAFLEEKIRSLEFIRNEQKECGAEVTVTDEEIDAARKRLHDLREARKSKNEED